MEKEVTAVVYDSRKVITGCMFLCIRGAVVDGHKFAHEVTEKGAGVLVVEEPVDVPENVTVIQVADTRYAMAFISAAWFGHPAEKLKTIGITGTKGKTTTTYMVKSIPEQCGQFAPVSSYCSAQFLPFPQTVPGYWNGETFLC